MRLLDSIIAHYINEQLGRGQTSHYSIWGDYHRYCFMYPLKGIYAYFRCLDHPSIKYVQQSVNDVLSVPNRVICFYVELYLPYTLTIDGIVMEFT
jgi:hypothetical protein